MKKNSGDKNTFLLYKDWKPLIDACTPEQAGEIIKGIYAYVCEGEAPEFNNPLLSGFFEMIRQAIDENDSAWAEKREKAKEKPAEDPEHKPAQKKKKEQKIKPDILPVRLSARTVFNACLKAYPISKELQATMESWLKYKTERRESYKEQGLRGVMKKASLTEKEYGTTAVIDIIEASMANNYQGITWDRIKRTNCASPPVKKNQFTAGVENNEYDFDALEEELASTGM